MKTILYESVIGYFLVNFQQINSSLNKSSKVETSTGTADGKIFEFKIASFAPYNSIEHTVWNCKTLAFGRPSSFLIEFLSRSFFNLSPNLWIIDPVLGLIIKKLLGIEAIYDMSAISFSRNFREQLSVFSRAIGFSQKKIAYNCSREKIKEEKNITDKFIVQTNMLIQNIDDDIRSLREICNSWFGLIYIEIPFLKIETFSFCLLLKYLILNRFSKKKCLEEINALTLNEEKSIQLFNSVRGNPYRISGEFNEKILIVIITQIIDLMDLRRTLHSYLRTKVKETIPNLYYLVGEYLSASLLSKSGSLRNLAKSPSSSLQILGSEKALFKALKNHANTPKYGILFNSKFVLKSSQEKRAKMSRSLANKCSLAIKIDYFSTVHTVCYGKQFKLELDKQLC